MDDKGYPFALEAFEKYGKKVLQKVSGKTMSLSRKKCTTGLSPVGTYQKTHFILRIV